MTDNGPAEDREEPVRKIARGGTTTGPARPFMTISDAAARRRPNVKRPASEGLMPVHDCDAAAGHLQPADAEVGSGSGGIDGVAAAVTADSTVSVAMARPSLSDLQREPLDFSAGLSPDGSQADLGKLRLPTNVHLFFGVRRLKLL